MSSFLKDNNKLVKEWNYEKNKDIDINKITLGSNKKVWWICDKGHEWQAVIASRTPVFLIEKRAKRGGGNIHNGFIAGIFAMIAGAQTVRTITTYSDGHKEVDDDNSQHWIAWVLAIILFITIAVFMFVWAFINYIRNYVLYF